MDPTSVLPSVQAGKGPDRSGVQQRSRGFALLITITLLAFLVLLLVSLAALTRVETQVASNNQQLSQARQNALMALNIALGELQKYTGPDQRTTARSDMDATLANTTTASGRWLGVYGSGAPADYTMTPSAVSSAVVAASDGRGSQAKLLNWLVSGNEDTAFDPDQDVGPAGNITTAPTAFAFPPTSPVANLSTASQATDTNLRVGTAEARLLVGPGTVNDSVSDYVVAPLREISAEMPGQGNAPVAIGRYAWWVGDEGAKARVNLPMSSVTQAPNAFVSAQRAAVELMDAIHSSANTTLAAADMLDPAGANSLYNPAASQLPKLLSTDQLPMLTPTSAATLSTTAKYRYHDLGAWSSAVLADTYAGGLKKDLSALFADIGSPHPSPHADTDLIFPPEPGDNTRHVGVPTWGQLRSFAQTTAPSNGLVPRSPSLGMATGWSGAPVPIDIGIHPVMTYAAFGFRFIAPDGDTVDNRITLAVVPVVVLWNPYTTPIRGTNDSGGKVRYEVGFRKTFADLIQLQGRPASSGALGSPYAWSATDKLGGTLDMGPDGVDRYYRFTIESPSGGIAPGESLVFTLQNSGEDYSPAGNILTNGFNDNYYVNIALPGDPRITATLGTGAFYRAGVNGRARTVDGQSIPQTMFGEGTDANWGGAGNGWHEAYLGSSGMGNNYPKTGYPWNSSNASQGIYQSFGRLPAPTVATAPYGSKFQGYAVSKGATGLLQPEDTLIGDMTLKPPAFRLIVHTVFSNAQAPAANLTKGRSRWMLHHNIRAFMMIGGSASFTGEPITSSWPLDISSPDDLHVASGTGLNEPVNETILYEFRSDAMPLLGIGQLQHANLGTLSSSPAHIIGNSNGVGGSLQYDGATPHPERLVKTGALDANSPGNKVTALYDQSWLVNRVLWDKYFVSTVPHKSTGIAADTEGTDIPDVLPNPLHVQYGPFSKPDLKDSEKAASKLLLNGGFNINSTSEQAWRAVLGATNQLDHDPTGSNTGGSAWDKITFSRFSKPKTNATDSPWLGYKRLDETQIAHLAKAIVSEIRARGPFVSLADFINRRLHTANASLQPNDPRLKGAMQAAIDSATTGAGAVNSIDVDSPLQIFADANPSYKVINAWKTPSSDAFTTGSNTPDSPTPPYGTSGAGCPQFLTQADVFSVIGSKLTARSDTFTIRTYGEVLDPVNSTSATPVVLGRAWCEAIVQRLPDYTDDSMPAETNLAIAPASAAKDTNSRFGRKYKILSFRWLSPNDI